MMDSLDNLFRNNKSIDNKRENGRENGLSRILSERKISHDQYIIDIREEKIALEKFLKLEYLIQFPYNCNLSHKELHKLFAEAKESKAYKRHIMFKHQSAISYRF